MAATEGARRMGVLACGMMTVSLMLLVFWWKASLCLFLSAWAVYGSAYLIEGFSSKQAGALHCK